MSETKEERTCPSCGAKVPKSNVYCPKCGKLVVKEKPKKAKRGKQYVRECPGCGSTITSSVLEQCPICNTRLEKVPESKKGKSEQKSGFIFTEKKLEPEQKYVLQKGTWNLKEALNVFGNSILIYITIRLIIFALFSFLTEEDGTSSLMALTMPNLLIMQLPEVLFGIYPLYYIYSRKHTFAKLGFSANSKKLGIAILIGVFGGIGLLFITQFFSEAIINLVIDLGLDFVDIQSYIQQENILIRNTEIYWLILLLITLSISAISSEVVFRGVLHNALIEKYGNDPIGRLTVIMITALGYGLIYLLFTFPVGLYFLIANIVMYIILGIIYEINKNIYNSIIAFIIYNLLVILSIVLLP
ncbi:MAG: CAAX amino terminal protease self-immunity [Promethearchaeota archaeon]|nr:MAG: CAAX amino terminal protease self-immunity [Candidatus Lokiarchaeota archaeon]